MWYCHFHSLVLQEIDRIVFVLHVTTLFSAVCFLSSPVAIEMLYEGEMVRTGPSWTQNCDATNEYRYILCILVSSTCIRLRYPMRHAGAQLFLVIHLFALWHFDNLRIILFNFDFALSTNIWETITQLWDCMTYR